MKMHFTRLWWVLVVLLQACATGPSFIKVKPGLFDLKDADTLGLEQAPASETFVAYKAQVGISQYNHGAVLFPFKNGLVLQWQSSSVDEDGADTQVLYATSADGKNWTKPQVLAAAREDALVTNGGWWSDGNTLVAFINLWPQGLEPKGGYVEYLTSGDGEHWSQPKTVRLQSGLPLQGVMEQDIKALASGRLLTAAHFQPGLQVAPIYTDDPLAVNGWAAGAMPQEEYKLEISRGIEPSWFRQTNGDLVMVFRDQAGSFKALASVSRDQGETWSKPELTAMPDSRAKQSAGNLPDGSAYWVNNPSGSKTRMPLVVSLSSDGQLFDRAFLLRGHADLPPMLYQGKYKRIGYSYPKSIVWNGYLWVSYAVNKEDIAVTRVPLSVLMTN